MFYSIVSSQVSKNGSEYFALKTLKWRNSGEHEMFIQEIETLEALRGQPSIIQLIDYDRDDEKQQMQLVRFARSCACAYVCMRARLCIV